MNTSKIKVYRNGKPASGVAVSLEFTDFTQMGFTKKFNTNSDGIAYVEHASTGTANVYLNGSKKGSMRTPGEEVFYL